MEENLLKQDYQRYINHKDMPKFQLYCRKVQTSSNVLSRFWWRLCFRVAKEINHIDMSYLTPIGGGLYIGHPYCITINHNAIIGRNVNIHKGVTIGRENRGTREGVPTIGNNVWICGNVTILPGVTIGDNSIIGAGSVVDKSVPANVVAVGTPCKVLKYLN